MSCEMLGWMKHKLESRFTGEISITSDMQMTPPLWQKAKNLFAFLMKEKEESEKTGLKLNIQKTKIMTSGPIVWSRSVVSDSLRPHELKPTRLLCPWDSPGKNTGVGCHFLFQCMKVKSQSEVAQSCLSLSDPMNWSLPGSSVHGIFQARVLESGAIAFSQLTLRS